MWEDFTIEHARLAREIKVETFEEFLTISDEEGKISAKVRAVFAREGFDVKKYVTDTQQQRAYLRRTADAQANARITAEMRAGLRGTEQDEELGAGDEGAGDEEAAAGQGSDETEWEAEKRE